MKIRKLHTWIELKREGIVLVLGFGVVWKAPGSRLYYSQRSGSNGHRWRGWWFAFVTPWGRRRKKHP